MGKFRSKLKGSTKGKRWTKGQSSSSNPETHKHRDLAKSRFFKENLGGSLTSEALQKHDALQAISNEKSDSESEAASSAGSSTYQTMDSFASEWSSCSNTSFKRFFSIFRANSPLHTEMLAVLAAITEVIKQKNGNESPTEYYCSLVTALEQVMSQDPMNEDQVTAILALLNMGIKTVPEGVLRTSFDDVCKKLIAILNNFSNADNNVVVKSVFGILTSLLASQDQAVWSLSSTLQIFGTILNPFCVHHKPKWRKPAQNAVILITKAKCFTDATVNPVGNKVAEFCRELLEECLRSNSSIKSNRTTILHVLGLMKDTIGTYSKAHLKKSCELILQLMTLNYPIVTSCGLQTLHSLLSQQKAVVPAKLNGQLISALYEYQPSTTDVQPTLAWVAVMQQAHTHLADVDLSMACGALPKIFETLVQLWLSEKKEITNAVTHSLEALLRDAILPLCETPELVEQHMSKLEKCFDAIELGLGYQYNTVWNQVLHAIAVMFEVGGKYGAKLMLGCLKHLAELRDSYKFSYNNELENAVGSAVKSMGPEVVLSVISLTKGNGDINIDRSWLLPVLKESIKMATLEFWIKSLLPLAMSCRQHSIQLTTQNEGINAHVYELLYIQLWSLLPNFCNSPTDIKTNFKSIAKVLGVRITNHKEVRLSIMASLRKLIVFAKENDRDDDLNEIARFDKNYLPLLFNFYTTKARDSEEEGHRLAALETIRVYLAISKPELTHQLFENALERLKAIESMEVDQLYVKDAILDIIRELVPYQNLEAIEKLYEQCIKGIPKMKNKKEQKKAFKLLEEILESDSDECKSFFKNNRKQLQTLLMKTVTKATITSKSTRLRCLNHLIKAQPALTHESLLLRSVIPEAVLCCKDANGKCKSAAYAVLNTVGNTLAAHNQLQEYLNMIVAGLTGSVQIMSATLMALSSVLYHFSGALGNENIQFLLENVGNIISSPSREVVGPCLSFVKIYYTSLPTPLVAASLPNIIKYICSMTDDCKRNFRLKIRDILDRLVRKYGCDAITPYVPTTDTMMLKKLRNLRKLNARKKSLKEAKRDKSESDEEEFTVKAKPKSIEEILADSDLEDSDTNIEPKLGKKQRKTWIREDPDTIVDFNDPTAISKITATKPTNSDSVKIDKKLNKNRGFKTAPDGRLIIKDLDFDSDSDSDKVKANQFSKLKLEDSDSDEEVSSIKTTRKRKRSEAGSVKSGFSNHHPPMKYQAGGSGIHRPIHKQAGSEYKAKKAGGDIKKKGKLDPYMYLPLQRTALNKRKKAKMMGQFKNIKKAAKSGALKGAKARRFNKE
ncbi:hypothetical protein RI129_006782 [Pyrocoelia pectoralis]|uniref:RRP12-like protein n=1 Tax=Pyrocoelia pectoralis TaxID=417401 RepID=A0AAN7ZIT2_9COLE